MDYMKESLKMHELWRGKIEMVSRVPLATRTDLSLAYTPGVAQACLEIRDEPEKSFALTRRFNTVAVVTDGSAVLGLGDIGALAGMPVMEGKCVLFKEFGGVDAIPLCVSSKDVDEIVSAVSLFAGSFGGINLEDISAPRCFEIEKKLKEKLDIPVFHDDQHGTAIVVLAACLNALKVVDKRSFRLPYRGVRRGSRGHGYRQTYAFGGRGRRNYVRQSRHNQQGAARRGRSLRRNSASYKQRKPQRNACRRG